MSFIKDVQERALHPDTIVDPSTEAWAARAFSVMAIIGASLEDGGDNKDEIVLALTHTLAKAPTVVVATGVMHTMGLTHETDNPRKV